MGPENAYHLWRGLARIHCNKQSVLTGLGPRLQLPNRGVRLACLELSRWGVAATPVTGPVHGPVRKPTGRKQAFHWVTQLCFKRNWGALAGLLTFCYLIETFLWYNECKALRACGVPSSQQCVAPQAGIAL
jgi:hypothetical protein